MARPKAGSQFSISQLESLLESRLSELQHLQKEHTRLSSQLTEIERRIVSLGGKTKGRGKIGLKFPGTRARNEKSLVESLEEVLGAAGGPLKVGDIVDGVLKSGYRTTSDNFRGIVNQTLIKERRRFVSAGRGVYVIKKK
jgi:hypothetical protein